VRYEEGTLVEGYDHGFDEACALDGYLASIEALNLFAEVIQTPALGCYQRLSDGCYLVDVTNETGLDQPIVDKLDDDPAACDGLVLTPAPGASGVRALAVDRQSPYRLAYGKDRTCADVYPILDVDGDVVSLDPVVVPYGVGRPSETIYDRTTYGYYFYYKPIVIGSWWEKWMAVKALGDPYTDFIGTDTSADVQSYLINFNSLFLGDVNDLVGGVTSDNARVYGPRVVDGQVEMLPLVSYAGSFDRATSDVPFLDPAQEYTLRLWAMFNAAYQGQWADDLEFAESIEVRRAHNITDVDVPADVRADPTRYAQLTDPSTGYVWYAINQARTNDSGGPIYSVGYQLIREIKDRYYVGGRDGPGDDWLPGLYEWQPGYDMLFLSIIEETARRFGRADVWEGDVDVWADE
jgi:hypothetical protein